MSLRTRVLAAIGVIAVLQLIVAFVVISTTQAQLVDQIDARLAFGSTPERDGAFALQRDYEDGLDDDVSDEGFDESGDLGEGPDGETPVAPSNGANATASQPSWPLESGHGREGRRGDPPAPPERLSDTYEGILLPDGTLVTFFAPNNSDDEPSAPDIDIESVSSSRGVPFTTDSVDGDDRYRVLASSIADGEFVVTAIPMDEVDETVKRLVWVLAATVASITAMLAALAWWVLRLGIAPVKRMTTSAAAIADGNLSERIEVVDARTEAGELGRALNTMMGTIETSFGERLEAEAKLRQFIADASHELRTPVATIRGYAELYRMGGLQETEALDDAMRRTEQESERMSRLIADLLDLAKLDRGPTLAKADVNLTQLASDTASDAEAAHPGRTVTVDAERARDPLVVPGDEDLLRQVLANVVINALVHTDPPATVAIRLSDEHERAVVEVHDDGPGMETEVAARITERFFRADTSRSRARGGSGLGLSIAQSAVDAHGGSLTVDSIVGEGTTVTIKLPSPT